MDDINRPPLMENPVESVTPNPTPPKKSKLLIISLVAVLLLASLFLYLLFFTKVFENLNLTETEDENSQENEQENPQEETPQSTMFNGDTFTAQIPNDWSMEEYYDGDGTDMLSDGDYTGLTGLKIFKNNTEMFYLKAIYGIGFAGCPSYAKFTDESSTYYNQILSDNQISGTELNISDYTQTEYSEFVWLGKTFRRVERAYTYDTVPNNSYFEPACVPTLVGFQGLEFQPEEGPAATSYDYSPTQDATLEDLDVIDAILESMTLFN